MSFVYYLFSISIFIRLFLYKVLVSNFKFKFSAMDPPTLFELCAARKFHPNDLKRFEEQFKHKLGKDLVLSLGDRF